MCYLCMPARAHLRSPSSSSRTPSPSSSTAFFPPARRPRKARCGWCHAWCGLFFGLSLSTVQISALWFGLIGSLRSDYRFRYLLKPVPPLGFVTAHVPSAVGYRLVRTSPPLVSSEGVLISSTSLTCLAVFYCHRRSSTTATGECLDTSVKSIHTHQSVAP